MPDTIAERPIDRVIAMLSRRSCSPESTGPGQWKSRCPVHKGKSFNLSVRETTDGAVLLHCHHTDNGRETCSPAAISAELGLRLRDLFPRKDKQAPTPRKANMGKAYESPEEAIASIVRRLGQPTAQWTYEEADSYGQRFPHMIVYRFDGKDGTKEFRPVHPEPEGWFLGDPPGKLPVYNLPEVTQAETVVVVEGEKCVDLVRQLGLTATTSAHGSKSPAKTDWRPLAGRSVVIIPDNDEPGEVYADSVAGLLNALTPKPKIKIIRLPVPEKGDDIEEWLRGVVPDQWDLGDCRLELQRLWTAAPEWQPPPGSTTGQPVDLDDQSPPNLTEWGNARRLASKFGDRVRYCYPKSQWLIWDGRRWSPDERGEIRRLAKEVPRLLIEEAKKEFFEDRQRVLQWALRSEQKRTIDAAVDLLWSEPGIGVMPDDFDREPWLLNTPSGVIDLLTGEIREQKPGDLLSKITLVEYDAECQCPRWKEVLSTVFRGDEELIAYVQRLLGYSLTGDVSEHALFLHYGTGRNGKNTILDTVREVMGDYATVADPKVFLTAGVGEHPAGLADLVGRRLVVTSEVDNGQQLAEGLVKRLTGDRVIKARFMHGNWFEYRVQFKISMLANHKPDVQGQDEGIWSRIRIVPYEVYIPPEKQVKGLSEILVREEGPGILAWLVDGCREWHRLQLSEPEKVTKAGKCYRAEQDVVGDFLVQCTDSYLDREHLRERVRISASALYRAYTDWCEANGERMILTNRKFGGEMTRRGYVLRPSDGKQYRYGLELKSRDDPRSVEFSASEPAF